MEQLDPSQSQPVCNPTLCVARDRGKVQSRRKYLFTDQIDKLIREIYLNQREAKSRPGHPATGQEGWYAALGTEEARP